MPSKSSPLCLFSSLSLWPCPTTFSVWCVPSGFRFFHTSKCFPLYLYWNNLYPSPTLSALGLMLRSIVTCSVKPFCFLFISLESCQACCNLPDLSLCRWPSRGRPSHLVWDKGPGIIYSYISSTQNRPSM